MSKIGRSDALRSLRSIFRLAGRRTVPDELDIERPLSLVYDTSDQAGKLTQVGVVTGLTVATGGAGAPVFSTLDTDDIINPTVLDALEQAGLVSESDRDHWFVSVRAATNTVGNFNTATVSVARPDARPQLIDPASTLTHAILVGAGTVTYLTTMAGGLADIQWTDGINNYPFDWLRPAMYRRPLLFEEIQFRTEDGAVGAATVVYRVYSVFTPKGIPPYVS